MLTLQTFPPSFDLPSGSPFCIKAMCLLELSGQEWKPKGADSRKAPNAKLPVLIDGDKVIPDSDAIRAHLEDNYNADFDKGLSAEQRATSRAVIRMVEEHLYFAVVSNRWLNDENWAKLAPVFFAKVPAPMRGMVAKMVRKGVGKQVYAQGMGRHSVADQCALAAKDIEAIKTLLGDKPFMFGKKPTAADASVIAMIDSLSKTPVSTPISQLVTDDEILMAYIERGREAMYPKG